MEIEISLGCYSEKLSKQLAGRIHPDNLAHFDMDADGITRLYVRGLLTERERDSARKRLIKSIQGALRQYGGSTNVL